MCVALPKLVSVMKWAPHPFDKFMKLKDIPVENKPNMMSIVESLTGDIRLYLDTPQGFRMYDFQSGFVEDVAVNGLKAEELGAPVKAIMLENTFALCYERDVG
jgi:hypothetical protein